MKHDDSEGKSPVDRADEDKVTRREFLARAGRWSPVVGATVLWSVAATSILARLGGCHDDSYTAYSDGVYSAYQKYCQGCNQNYNSSSDYCDYGNYSNGCFK